MTDSHLFGLVDARTRCPADRFTDDAHPSDDAHPPGRRRRRAPAGRIIALFGLLLALLAPAGAVSAASLTLRPRTRPSRSLPARRSASS